MAIVVSAFCIFFKGKIETDMLIMSLQITMDIVVNFSIAIRFATEVHHFMISSQKIVHYTQLDSEDELKKPIDDKVLAASSNQWPSLGVVEFEKVSMKYREDMQPSLKELSFVAQAGMKVGIVGRTGAGKSTILQTLFRLTETCEGTIKIDGTNIKDIGLHLLRKNI